MVPETVLCRCGAHLPLLGGWHTVEEAWRGVAYRYLWAGASCECGFIVQYAQGGDASDYRHCRWWHLGKEAEVWAGAPRRWPPAWTIPLPYSGPLEARPASPWR